MTAVWSLPPSRPSIAAGEVHVWHFRLDGRPGSSPDGCGGDPESLLSPDERERAGGFRFARDRRRYVAARGMMRGILAGYIAAAPGSLHFAYSPYGKPWLPSAPGLRFNLSHAGDHALLAVGAGEVGVDIELLRADLDVGGIARSFFSPGEVAALAPLSEEARRLLFFRIWTRKESYVKGTGMGMMIPLHRVDVLSDTIGPQSGEGPEGSPEWFLHDLNPGYDCAAALAVNIPSAAIRCWSRDAG